MLVFGLIVAGLIVAEWAWWHRKHTSRQALVLRAGLAVGLFGGAALALPGPWVLDKCLGKLAMPAGLLWLLLLALAAVAWHARNWRAVGVVLGVWMLYTLCGNGWVGGRVTSALEAPYVQIDPFAQAPFDAVLVMGGGTGTSRHGRVHLTSSGDRVVLAARLYRAGRTELLVSSGETIPGAGSRHDSARATARLWRDLGVDAEDIVQVDDVHNTREEIHAYEELVAQRGWARVGLVTSAVHLRRAMARAEDVGLDVHPLPADRGGGASWQGLYSLIPSGPGFASVHDASWEIVGALVGR